MQYYSALKRNEILASDTTWMNSEDMLNEISQLYNTNTVYLNLYEVYSLDNFIEKGEWWWTGV